MHTSFYIRPILLWILLKKFVADLFIGVSCEGLQADLLPCFTRAYVLTSKEGYFYDVPNNGFKVQRNKMYKIP